MALGTTSAILLAGGAFTAASQVMGANAQAKNIQKQAEHNAQIYGQQAEMIKNKKEISEYQFNRDAARARGSIVARTAGKGFALSGSPLAILIDNETQMQFDKAIQDYNYDMDINFAKSGATYTRETGREQSRLARFQGYSNAFSTMLSAGTNIAMLDFAPQYALRGGRP